MWMANPGVERRVEGEGAGGNEIRMHSWRREDKRRPRICKGSLWGQLEAPWHWLHRPLLSASNWYQCPYWSHGLFFIFPPFSLNHIIILCFNIIYLILFRYAACLLFFKKKYFGLRIELELVFLDNTRDNYITCRNEFRIWIQILD